MQRTAWLMTITLGLALAPAALAQEQKDEEQQPALNRVVFYKHGVGYFEREATVSGETALTLRFPEEQMKDVLKTLFAVDLSGSIRSIDYDSKEPISKRLAAIPLDIPGDRALSKFLGNLRGAPLSLGYAGEQVEGRVMGTEPYDRRTSEGTISRPRLVVLRNDGVIQAVDLFEVDSLKLLDPVLNKDLQKLLALSLRTRQLDLKEVRVKTAGAGKDRRVRIGYLIEAPIWKTSYRLLTGIGDKPLLQGWAIVENPSEEDWEDVEMTFVSGNPLSFVLDLYTSYYPLRPVIDVARVAARPSGRPATESPAPEPSRRMARLRDAAKNELAAAADAEEAEADYDDFASTLEPQTEGAAAGEMFIYRATERVNIPAGRAAMVPILLQELDKAEDVLLYRRSFSETPAHAVWLENSSDYTLESGPITFFEADTAQGEGLLPRILKPGMEEIVPYALEPGVTVEVMVDGETRPIYRVRFAGGVMYQTYAHERKTTYRLANETQTARKLVLDHPAASGYQLVEGGPESKRVVGHHRFTLALAAAEEEQLDVREIQERVQSLSLSSISADQLGLYLEKPYLSPAAKEFLERIIAEKEAISGLEAARQRLEKEERELLELEERIRSNVKILKDSPEERQMRASYLQELVNAEDRLRALHLELKDVRQQEADKRKRLQALIVSFEG